MRNGYELFVRPLLFSLDAETAHHVTMRLLSRASHFDVALRALKLFQPTPKPITLFGLNFPNPIGLAAGLDPVRDGPMAHRPGHLARRHPGAAHAAALPGGHLVTPGAPGARWDRGRDADGDDAPGASGLPLLGRRDRRPVSRRARP